MVNVTPKQLGKNVRMSFGKINEALEMPNLIEVQKIPTNGSEKRVLKRSSVT